VLADDRLVVSIEEAAELLGISRNHGYELAGRGALPILVLGGRKMVPKAYLRQVREWTGSGPPPGPEAPG